MRRMLTVALMAGTPLMVLLIPDVYPQKARSGLDNHHAHTVSLIRLIANRSDCDGEQIRVIGYLAGAGLDEGLGVFVSESDGRNGILTNAVDLDLAANDRKTQDAFRGLIGKYVIVSGLYHAPPPHGDFNGYIDHILEVKLLNPGSTSK